MGLWDAPASDEPIFTPEQEEQMVEALEKLTPECIKEMQEDPVFQEKLRKRLAPYRTKVDWEKVLRIWLP